MNDLTPRYPCPCESCKGIVDRYLARKAAEQAAAHPSGCSCAIPCRTCGHESEQHAGSLFGGTGPRRCLMPACTCKGAYIGNTPARCKQVQP